MEARRWGLLGLKLIKPQALLALETRDFEGEPLLPMIAGYLYVLASEFAMDQDSSTAPSERIEMARLTVEGIVRSSRSFQTNTCCS